jgi:hypothetical protein
MERGDESVEKLNKGVLIWLCRSSTVILLLWLIIITVLFGILRANNASDIKILKKEYLNLSEVVQEIVECCDDFPPECNCTAPGTDVVCWDADANIPPLMSGVAPDDNETLYIVCNPGNTSLDNNTEWELGDYARFLNDTGTWFQNRALGTGALPHISTTIDWTCSLWTPQTQNSTLDIFTVQDGWYRIQIGGLRPDPQGCSVGVDECNITSAALPSFLQLTEEELFLLVVRGPENIQTSMLQLGSNMIIYHDIERNPFECSSIEGQSVGFFPADFLYNVPP